MIPGLPNIMVAPNGARKNKEDHRGIPMTIPETVREAKACYGAGANALHAHVRDENGKHLLDAGLYLELLHEMDLQVPEMAVQITTEAVGIYSASQQRALVREVKPQAISASIRELCSDGDDRAAREFYHWAFEENIAVQHIAYDDDDVRLLARQLAAGQIPNDCLQMIFVLGRYSKTMESEPGDLLPFINARKQCGLDKPGYEWAVCAFGKRETDCLEAAMKQGGKVRVGFENSFYNRDGSIAKDNAERVAEIVAVSVNL